MEAHIKLPQAIGQNLNLSSGSGLVFRWAYVKRRKIEAFLYIVNMGTLTKNPFLSFTVAAVLIYLVVGKLDFLRFQMPSRLSNWLHFVGLVVAFLFSLVAVINGVKQIKRKENSFAYNLIAPKNWRHL